MDTLDKAKFTQFVTEIKTKIREAQLEALQAVNKRLIDLNWNLGKMIVERQEAHDWGKSVVEKLATELQKEFPHQQGFSSRNLWNMRDFYLELSKNEFLQPLVAEIGWSKNLIIFSKCKDELQREFHLRMTKKFGWTKNVLIHQVLFDTYLCPSKNDRHATRCKHLHISFCTSAYRNGLCPKPRRGQTQR